VSNPFDDPALPFNVGHWLTSAHHASDPPPGFRVLRRLPAVRIEGLGRLVYLGTARSVTRVSDLLSKESRRLEAILLLNDAQSHQTLVDAVESLPAALREVAQALRALPDG